METPLLPLTILVVDDARGFANGLTALLRRDGHTVETAATGTTALRQVRARRYALILCDLRLPERDGPALSHLLKTAVPAMHQRVVFLTAETRNPVRMAFLEHHHLVWLPKPCSAAQVCAVMHHALQQAAYARFPRRTDGAAPLRSLLHTARRCPHADVGPEPGPGASEVAISPTARGRVRVKVVPCPSTLSTVTCPSCAARISWTI
jgi:CheY-like chemotaxis protein